MRWRRIAQRTRRHDLPEFLEFAKLRGTRGTLRNMIFDLARVAGIDLAVDQSMQQDAGFLTVHVQASSPSAASQAARNSSRARASRDITVPIGTSMIVAISR